MRKRVLLETGFLLALSPRDKNHAWALKILNHSRENRMILHISPASFIEVSLILKSHGLSEDKIAQVLRTMEEAINLYTRPRYLSLEPRHVSRAAELRARYSQLTFFDSLHASVALEEKLIYMDMDPVVKSVIESEAGSY